MRRILTILATCGAAFAAMLVAPAAAQAAPCSHGTNAGGQSVSYCPIWVPTGGAPVYASTNTGSGVVDHLYAGGTANWFYCKQNGGTARASGYTSSNWAKTVGDDNGATGWVPAVYYSGAENYWNSLPDCATAPPPPPPPPSGGTASGTACERKFTKLPARALAMIQQACAQRKYIYSWNGGHGSAPGATYGSCVDGDAWNDCHVIGFDCSGLVRYAYYRATGTDRLKGYTWTQWARAHAMPHRAELTNAQQSKLRPGDLMWFGASGPSSHHIAIYVGGGHVINAFHSTEHIGVTGYDHADFLGAVRIW